MKQLLAVVFLSAVLFGCGTLSTGVSGDKNLDEIEKSQELFAKQVTHHKQQIKDLTEEGSQLTGQLVQLSADSSASIFALDRCKKRIKENDSLASFYLKEMKSLEIQANEFLIRAGSKDNQKYVNLTVRDPQELADAFAAVSYYDSIGPGRMIDSAIVLNTWQQEVFVTIRGPGGFRTATNIKRGEEFVLTIPGPGYYSVAFEYGNLTKTVSRQVDCINSDFYKKNKYAFIATSN